MWQAPLGWEMTVKSGPTFRTYREERLDLTTHTQTWVHCICTVRIRHHALCIYPNILRCWRSLKPTLTTTTVEPWTWERKAWPLSAWTSMCSAHVIWQEPHRVTQTKGKEALRETSTTDLSQWIQRDSPSTSLCTVSLVATVAGNCSSCTNCRNWRHHCKSIIKFANTCSEELWRESLEFVSHGYIC